MVVVEGKGNLAAELEMLGLIFADRNMGCAGYGEKRGGEHVTAIFYMSQYQRQQELTDERVHLRLEERGRRKGLI